MLLNLLLFCILFNLTLAKIRKGPDLKRKPIYIIGHQINSIEEVIPFLENGANVLESDVQFYPDGSIKELYHRCPGDCNRICNKRVPVEDYLHYIRKLTDPLRDENYNSKLIMLFFDLKLEKVQNITNAGRELAEVILDYLWLGDKREHEVRILIYIEDVKHKDAISGFLKEFEVRNQSDRLKNVGFDGGIGNITHIDQMFAEFQIQNVWIGDGTFNCLSNNHPEDRLTAAIDVRNSGGFIKKVYDWTVDWTPKMKRALDLGVDGFITNKPKRLKTQLRERYERKRFRLATVFDSPFSKFEL